MSAGRRPAVFLDRDGVLNENRADYVKSIEEFELLPGIEAPLRDLASRLLLIVVTNQSPVGRGIIQRRTVEEIHRHMVSGLAERGVRIDAVLYCPHTPQDHCRCRKPRPGLLFEAASRFDVDLERSYLIGDAASDVEAALAAGVSPLLVLTGRGAAQRRLLRPEIRRVPVVADLAAAADRILAAMAQPRVLPDWPHELAGVDRT